MTRAVSKFVFGFVILAAVVLAAAILTVNRSAPTLPLPNPNGYDDLVKAGQMMTNQIGDYEAMSQAELRAALTNNAEALKLVRLGLSRQCRVPLDHSPTNAAHIENLAVFKRIALRFIVEGRLAEQENRPGEAAASYLDMLRLGNEAPRGGFLVDALVGISIESMGLARLEKLLPKLDAKQSRELVSALETLESKRQSLETILKQEHAWARRVYGLRGQMVRLIRFRSLRKMEQNLAGRFQSQQLRNRRLIIDLAARAYELEKGERPKALADLVPAYLKAIPQDPLTGTNIIYRP